MATGFSVVVLLSMDLKLCESEHGVLENESPLSMDFPCTLNGKKSHAEDN